MTGLSHMAFAVEAMAGIRLHRDRYLCQPRFVRWKKTHRKSRIRKKWRKKYGAVTACAGYAYEMKGIGVIACPCMYDKIKKELS